MQHTGRHQVQDDLLIVDHQGVARIVPALEADHDVGVLGENVDDFSFSLVSPLDANSYDGWHTLPLTTFRGRTHARSYRCSSAAETMLGSVRKRAKTESGTASST